MSIAVLGAGAWGTTLAHLLAEKGHYVSLWARDQDLVERIRINGKNDRYLPDTPLSSNLRASSRLQEVLSGARLTVLAVPCQYLRGVLQRAEPYYEPGTGIVCASKGIELSSLKPMSFIVEEVLGGKNPVYAILSGPSFAYEVSQGFPTAASLGCYHADVGEEIQRVLSTDRFRVYTNPDVTGVELGGAIKNVMALATGISDGLGFGLNSRAALITRGLAEMSRLGKAMGGQAETFMGLSGMGDLVLTCTGALSRNRQVGLRLGSGERLSDILASMHTVAEGVKTAEAISSLSRRKGVEMPITEQVCAILQEGRDPELAVGELMSRRLKDE